MLEPLKQAVCAANLLLPDYPLDAVHNAVVLEEIAMMAWHCQVLSGGAIRPMQSALLDKHYLRKHGDGAYYGQRN